MSRRTVAVTQAGALVAAVLAAVIVGAVVLGATLPLLAAVPLALALGFGVVLASAAYVATHQQKAVEA